MGAGSDVTADLPGDTWLALDEDGLWTDDMMVCRSILWLSHDKVPDQYPDVRPFPLVTEVQVVTRATASLGTDRLTRPSPDRLRVTLHGLAVVSSPVVWEWLGACCPHAQVTCVFRLGPGVAPHHASPREVLEVHLGCCAVTTAPQLRTLVMVDDPEVPRILTTGPWRAPWLWQLRHLVIDTWAMGSGLPALLDLSGLQTLDWRAHAHEVPRWPTSTPSLLTLVSSFWHRLSPNE